MTYVYACLAGAGGGASVIIGTLLALKQAAPMLMRKAMGIPNVKPQAFSKSTLSPSLPDWASYEIGSLEYFRAGGPPLAPAQQDFIERKRAGKL